MYRYRHVKEQLEQVKAERDVLKQQLTSNPNAQKVELLSYLALMICTPNKWREIKPQTTNIFLLPLGAALSSHCQEG